MPSLAPTLSALVVLALLPACGGETPAPAPTSDPSLHEIDFSGDRHSLPVSLMAPLTAGDLGERALDLRLRKEAGHSFSVAGNGRRSVAFVRKGTAADFDTFARIETWKDLGEFVGESSVYFSPELRRTDAVEGTMFLAHAGEKETGEVAAWARVRIERIEDTRVTLRVVIGPPLVP